MRRLPLPLLHIGGRVVIGVVSKEVAEQILSVTPCLPGFGACMHGVADRGHVRSMKSYMRTADFTQRMTASIAFRDQQPFVGNTPADALISDLSRHTGDFGADGLGKPVSQLTK
jgi:hypothetical protein